MRSLARSLVYECETCTHLIVDETFATLRDNQSTGACVCASYYSNVNQHHTIKLLHNLSLTYASMSHRSSSQLLLETNLSERMSHRQDTQDSVLLAFEQVLRWLTCARLTCWLEQLCLLD